MTIRATGGMHFPLGSGVCVMLRPESASCCCSWDPRSFLWFCKELEGLCVSVCACVRVRGGERGERAPRGGSLGTFPGWTAGGARSLAAATRRTSGPPCRRGSTRSCRPSTTPARTAAADTSCACSLHFSQRAHGSGDRAWWFS